MSWQNLKDAVQLDKNVVTENNFSDESSVIKISKEFASIGSDSSLGSSAQGIINGVQFARNKTRQGADNSLECALVANEIRGKIAEYLALQAGKDSECANTLGRAVTGYANTETKCAERGLTGNAYNEAMKAAALESVQMTDMSFDDFYAFNSRSQELSKRILHGDEQTFNVKPDHIMPHRAEPDDYINESSENNVSEIRDALTSAWNKAEQVGQNVYNAIPDNVKRAGSTLVDGVKTAATASVDFARGIYDDFVSDSVGSYDDMDV